MMSDLPLRVLRTGQLDCFDELGMNIDCRGSAQDGAVRAGMPWPTPRFVVEGAVARDRLSGLCWPIDTALCEYPMMWQEALDAVTTLNAAKTLGYTDWRMPTRRELTSLLSYQQTRPPLPAGHPFVNLFASWYWSSTTAAYQPAYAWYLDMDGGRVFYGGKEQSFMLLPVRGKSNLPLPGQRGCFDNHGEPIDCAGSGQDGAVASVVALPQPRFGLRGEIVSDHWTGLEWHAYADQADGPVSWAGAMACVATLAGESSRPWRLPNINELESLVDYDRACPALPADSLFSAVRDAYWSSTTSVYEPDWAWVLYLDKGAVGVGQKKGKYFHVMAVR